jgi:hypothetical protein
MGFLTTVTIRNDALHSIEEDSEIFLENLISAIRENKAQEIGAGSHANAAIVQEPRHADDWAIYVHAGNTVTHMSAFSRDAERFAEINPEFFKGMIKYIIDQGKVLKLKFKDIL